MVWKCSHIFHVDVNRIALCYEQRVMRRRAFPKRNTVEDIELLAKVVNEMHQHAGRRQIIIGEANLDDPAMD